MNNNISQNSNLKKRDYDKLEVAVLLKKYIPPKTPKVKTDPSGKNPLHVVFVADSDSSVFLYHSIECGLTVNQVADASHMVNEKNETGTFAPKVPITILPLSIYKNRNDIGNKNQMILHIKDVFKANINYLKCDEIFFLIESRRDFDKELAKSVLSELIEQGETTGATIISFLE